MDLPGQAKKRKTLTALSSHPSSTSSGGSASSSTSPYFANAPTSTATSVLRGRGGLGLGLRRGLANTQQQQQQQPTAVSPQAAPTPAGAAPPKPQSRPLALQQRQRQQPTHAQTQTQTQLQLQPQQRTPSPPQPKPPQPTRPAAAPTQPRQQPTLPARTQAPRGGGQEQEYRVPGLEAMRWMDEPPAAEPHARPMSTVSQQQQKPVDIAFLVTPPTLNLLRCLQPEFVGPPVIHPSAMLSRDQVEELFGSLLRVLDDRRPTADGSDDEDEVVLWQARSLTAAEWKDGFAGALRPLLCRTERVQALVAKCPSAALCRTLLHHYLPALLAGSSGAAHSTTTSSSLSSPPSSSFQGLLHSLLQTSGGFGDGSPPDRLAGQLLPILSSFSCAHSSSAASETKSATPPQKKPRTK